MTERTAYGRVIVISGPSGSGKSTVLQRLFQNCPLPLCFSVSATTRLPRPGEVDGKSYHFLSVDEFARRRERGDFLECFEVYGKGYWYGTLRSEVQRALDQRKWVVLEIDVQGAAAALAAHPDAVTIFLLPRTPDELEQRLRLRGTETEAQLQARLAAARKELDRAHEYQHQVVNDSADRAADEICRILLSRQENVANA